MKDILVCALAFGLISYLLLRCRCLHIWLPGYFRHCCFARESVAPEVTRHILFLFVDHFEPHVGQVDDPAAMARLQEWLERFPEMAGRHWDADGCPPRHTFFYPYDEYSPEEMRSLSALCAEGWGEIELQLHHKDDTSETLKSKLSDAVRTFSRYGACVHPETSQPAFGFVHGNWALDNSRLERGQNLCGVNDELTLLREAGCFADFTLPSRGTAQTRKVNSIYYALDDPARPKSHDTGIDAKVGQPPPAGGFLLIQGPLALNWRRRKFGLLPAIEDGSITLHNPPTPDRIDLWISTGIHVRGRPEWIFVKVHTHGASPADLPAVLGDPAEQMYRYLETRYNDGRKYKLHYVTAREAYNIVKAAEAGLKADPDQYRNYIVPVYRYKNEIFT